jgi:hypothetical protein
MSKVWLIIGAQWTGYNGPNSLDASRAGRWPLVLPG